jgi:hypothetical protein
MPKARNLVKPVALRVRCLIPDISGVDKQAEAKPGHAVHLATKYDALRQCLPSYIYDAVGSCIMRIIYSRAFAFPKDIELPQTAHEEPQ